MIRIQIIERPGADLFRTMLNAMRSGTLRTFFTRKRGRQVFHTSQSTPGWMNWTTHDGIILCEVLSPRKPGQEWKFFDAFLGRLADRFATQIHSINIQFCDGVDRPDRAAKKRRR